MPSARVTLHRMANGTGWAFDSYLCAGVGRGRRVSGQGMSLLQNN